MALEIPELWFIYDRVISQLQKVSNTKMFPHQFQETVLFEEGNMCTGFDAFDTTRYYHSQRSKGKDKAVNLRGFLAALGTLLQARLQTLAKWVRINFVVVVVVICTATVMLLLNHCYQSDVYNGGDVSANYNDSTDTKIVSNTKATQFVPALLNDAHFQETIVDVNALAIELQQCVCSKDVGRNYDVIGMPVLMDQKKPTTTLLTASLLFNAEIKGWNLGGMVMVQHGSVFCDGGTSTSSLYKKIDVSYQSSSTNKRMLVTLEGDVAYCVQLKRSLLDAKPLPTFKCV